MYTRVRVCSRIEIPTHTHTVQRFRLAMLAILTLPHNCPFLYTQHAHASRASRILFATGEVSSPQPLAHDVAFQYTHTHTRPRPLSRRRATTRRTQVKTKRAPRCSALCHATRIRESWRISVRTVELSAPQSNSPGFTRNTQSAIDPPPPLDKPISEYARRRA